MPENAAARELTADEVRLSVGAEHFGFQTTAELKPLDKIVGQPRAMRALDLGLGVRHPNYHVYAAGMTGTGKMEMIRRALRERMHDVPVPPDWLYVHNFDEPDRPLAISLPAGEGMQLNHDLQNLVEKLLDALPKAFRQEDFGREKDRLRKEYRQRGEEILAELDKMARKLGLTVEQLPDGQLLFIPLKDGRPMTPEEVQQLSPEEMSELERHQQELVDVAGNVLKRQHEIGQQLTRDVRQVAREFAARLIGPLVKEIAGRYESKKLRGWLEQLKSHLVEHIDRFHDRSAAPTGVAALLGEAVPQDERERFLEYQVNVMVDNSGQETAPVVLEDAPNYRNLFGTIERVVDRFGRVMTNFNRIKPGSLLRANGGYLVLNLMDALTEPFVWKELKRTLKRGSLEIETYDPFSMITVSALKPEPIPLRVKLVALGEPLVYHLLYLYDADFREIFRVKADFDAEMDRDEQAGRLYGQFVRRLSDTEGILPFDAEGVSELVSAGARLARDRTKLSAEFSRIADLIRESDYWARREQAEVVTGKHVLQAARERVFRSDMIAEKIRDMIADGTLLISIDEPAVGQVNGLAVANLGDYAFGRPTRVTVSVGVGAAGIINIERESRLSGETFDKAVFILEGYLRNVYAREQPLALSASIAMEQSYGGIDGDSASIAELVGLLSALAEIPLRQDVAITGSVNQRGEVQAVGGVNEKVEGFFDVCRQKGLTGQQGVCLPESNVAGLVLRSDATQAIQEGQFHVWAAKSVNEVIELVSGQPAGDVQQEGTFHHRVQQKLQQMADALKRQRPAAEVRSVSTSPAPPTTPDPRPRLPGNE